MNPLALKNQYDNLSNTSKYIALGSVAILGLTALSYFKGKDAGSTTIKPVPLPKEGGQLNENERQKVRGYSLKLHEDLTEIFGIRDNRLYQNLNSESDKVLVAIYNDFNNLYGNEDNGTLTQWLQDELVPTYTMKPVIDRMINLSLA